MVTWLDIDTDDAPRVALIDATLEEHDEAALRRRARELGAAVGAGAVSRSYCHPYALVASHTGPIGVDIERIVACDERFARSICTPTEMARTPWASDREIVSLWSGKEALAKALGDAVLYDPRRLESPASWTEPSSGAWRTASVPAPDGYCAWVCWRIA
ncbi:MAG TPA: 4'-phosphopantetheinyl transferase superfamily protein [Solirubrobacteraceae bacterium]|jgi:phosphopantetheinyl transferase